MWTTLFTVSLEIAVRLNLAALSSTSLSGAQLKTCSVAASVRSTPEAVTLRKRRTS